MSSKQEEREEEKLTVGLCPLSRVVHASHSREAQQRAHAQLRCATRPGDRLVDEGRLRIFRLLAAFPFPRLTTTTRTVRARWCNTTRLHEPVQAGIRIRLGGVHMTAVDQLCATQDARCTTTFRLDAGGHAAQ